MIERLGKLFSDCRGATAVEYGLIISLVMLACMGAVIAVADSSLSLWNNVSTEVSNAK